MRLFLTMQVRTRGLASASAAIFMALVALSTSSVCAGQDQDPPSAIAPGADFTMPFEKLWLPWTGDLPGMVERRVLRVVVPYGGYQFYYDRGEPKGAVYEMLRKFENYLNEQLDRQNIRVYVAIVPVSRDKMFASLLAGNADLIAADLTETDRRNLLVDFTRPLLTNIDEIVVSGPGAAPPESLDDLAGRDIFVGPATSYHEHLVDLAADFRRRGLVAPNVILADELLETHDILEMVNAGLVELTVADDYKAEFWSEVYPNVQLHHDLRIHSGGQTSWAYRKDSPELAVMLDSFMRRYGKGTLVGNDTYSRYLADAERVQCAPVGRSSADLVELESAFRSSASEFEFDWLMLAAQAFQESRFHHGRRSPAGAVGVMQIKPSTAADRNVGIADISTIENNVRAGAKYLRFLMDRYFDAAAMDELDRWFFGLAAYNAGPARVARLRNQAAAEGYDRNVWFDNVEIVAGRRIGRETTSYVGNIFKYFLGYHLIQTQESERKARLDGLLAGCQAIDAAGLPTG
jgi:membrane-bound lytic murein transglycosylase MltF